MNRRKAIALTILTALAGAGCGKNHSPAREALAPADVLVSMPGTGSKEIEERVTRPMEKLLWEIPGVEYIYSTSSPGQSLVIVRFVVGSDAEQSIVRLNQKLQANYDNLPHGVSNPLNYVFTGTRRMPPNPRSRSRSRSARA